MRSPTIRLTFAAAVLTLLPLGPAAHAADGDLDPGFWGDGKVALPGFAGAPFDIVFGGLATKATGEMAVGYHVHAAEEFAYWRTATDSTWGPPCQVIVEETGSDIDTFVLDMAFDSSGRLIVLAKKLYNNGGTGWNVVLAYDFPDCALDPGFAEGGIRYLPGATDWGANASRLAALEDGRILIAGGKFYFDEDSQLHRLGRVIRLEPDGSFDSTFGTAGIAEGPEDTRGVDVAVAENGHVVMAAVSLQAGDDDFLVQDYGPDGTFLAETAVSFNLGLSDDDVAAAIAATSDGRIVVVGTASGNGIQAFTWAAMAVLWWDAQANLTLDPSFSGDGKHWFSFNSRNYSSLSDLAIEGEDGILVAGTAKTQIIANGMAVARLALDGAFDSTFYPPGNGRRLVEFDVAPPENDLALRLALQSGRILLGGQVDIANDVSSIGLARLENQWVFSGGFDVQELSGWEFTRP